MADNVTAPIDMHAVFAQDPIQNPMPEQMPADVSTHDVQQFQHALINSQFVHLPAQTENVTAASAVRGAIAAFETKEAENKARILQMLSPNAEITPTTVLAFNTALEERNIGYSFAKQMISAPSQWIKELTSMQ